MGAYAPSVLCFLIVPTLYCISSEELGTSENALEAITSTMQCGAHSVTKMSWEFDCFQDNKWKELVLT